jgi:protein gp37
MGISAGAYTKFPSWENHDECGCYASALGAPLRPEWARAVRDQCVAAGVPFFFKQWGGLHCRIMSTTVTKE